MSKKATTRFFYKQRFFLIQSHVLLNTYKDHHSEILFICTMFVFMFRPRSIYIVSM